MILQKAAESTSHLLSRCKVFLTKILFVIIFFSHSSLSFVRLLVLILSDIRYLVLSKLKFLSFVTIIDSEYSNNNSFHVFS